MPPLPRTPRVVGCRLAVRDIPPILDMEEKAKAAGLHLVILDENVPQPTSGVVIALGTDPLVAESINLNDEVSFHKWAGTKITTDGAEYRVLDLQEVIQVLPPSTFEGVTGLASSGAPDENNNLK